MKTNEFEKQLDFELKKQEELTASFTKLVKDNLMLQEELKLQAKVIVQLQQDVFELRKTVGNIFRVVKERGWMDGTYVAGAVIK